MAAADNYELTIDQARDWEWAVRWKVGKTERSSVPKPGIVNYQFSMGFKEDYKDTTCIVLLTNGHGISVTEDGWITLLMTHDKCATLPAGRLVWELVGVSPENKMTALGKGTAVVLPKVV